jgi:hypothetical protein
MIGALMKVLVLVFAGIFLSSAHAGLPTIPYANAKFLAGIQKLAGKCGGVVGEIQKDVGSNGYIAQAQFEMHDGSQCKAWPEIGYQCKNSHTNLEFYGAGYLKDWPNYTLGPNAAVGGCRR